MSMLSSVFPYVPHPLLNEILSLAGENVDCDKEALSKKLYEIEKAASQRALALMLKELYDFDLNALTADIAKIELLEADKVVEKRDRKKLLRAFWWIISVYYEGNVKKAIQTCNDIKAFK